jgi:hypothetical protein
MANRSLKETAPTPLQARAWVLSTAWLLLGGCQEGELPHFGTLQYESENFEVWASDGLEACAGTYDYVEQWLAAFRARVGEHGDHARHTFYWLTPEDFEHDLCLGGRIACAYPYSNVIYSTVIPVEHEIVHTELDAQAPSVLGEGAAEVFGSISSPLFSSRIDVDPLLDDVQIPGGSYETAGRFSRFVIERYGLDAYFELYEALDGAPGRNALAEAVGETLGIELAALVEDFDTTKACSVDRWRYFDHECSTIPLTPWESPTRWRAEIDVSCAADDVIGPRKDLSLTFERESVIWTLRALEVEEAGIHALTIESADPSAEVGLFSCGGSCFDLEGVPATDANVRIGSNPYFSFTAGRHWLRVQHSAESDAPVVVTIERL